MLISIILPIYNGYEFFDGCLQSIQAQTFRDFECLIGINGYEEENEIYKGVLLKTRNDSRFRVFNFAEKGAAATINKLIGLAEGKWVAHIDVDDLWHPEKLEYQFQYLSNNDIDVCGTNTRYFGNLTIAPELRFGELKAADFLYMNPIIHSSAVVKKDVVLYDPSYVAYDYECWCRLFFIDKRRFYNIPILLTYHRIHDNSYFNSKGLQEKDKIVEKYEKIARGE